MNVRIEWDDGMVTDNEIDADDFEAALHVAIFDVVSAKAEGHEPTKIEIE